MFLTWIHLKKFLKQSYSLSFFWCACVGVVPALADNGAPEGLVTFYVSDAPSNDSLDCPEGWSSASVKAAEGRLLFGGTDAKRRGKTSGKKTISPDSLPAHQHSYSGSVNIPHLKQATVDGETKVGRSGNYHVSGKAQEDSLNLPYIQYLVCKKESCKGGCDDSLPYSSVAFFDTKKCPANWSCVRDNETCIEGAYGIVPIRTSKEMGFFGAGWDLKEPPQHNHTYKWKIALKKVLLEELPGENNTDIATYDTYDMQITTGKSKLDLPIVEYLLCQKTNGNPPNPEIESGISIFYAGDSVPTNWKQISASAHRLLVGLDSTSGTQGQKFGDGPKSPADISSYEHSHGIKGSFSMPSYGTDLGKKILKDKNFTKPKQTYSLNAETESSSASLPVIGLWHIEPSQ